MSKCTWHHKFIGFMGLFQIHAKSTISWVCIIQTNMSCIIQTWKSCAQLLCVNNINKHTTSMFKQYKKNLTFMFKPCIRHQCLNNISRWMTSMSISYKLMENKFCTTIIAKSWFMNFVMGIASDKTRQRQKGGSILKLTNCL
jgi:hypothetical protein